MTHVASWGFFLFSFALVSSAGEDHALLPLSIMWSRKCKGGRVRSERCTSRCFSDSLDKVVPFLIFLFFFLLLALLLVSTPYSSPGNKEFTLRVNCAILQGKRKIKIETEHDHTWFTSQQHKYSSFWQMHQFIRSCYPPCRRYDPSLDFQTLDSI